MQPESAIPTRDGKNKFTFQTKQKKQMITLQTIDFKQLLINY